MLETSGPKRAFAIQNDILPLVSRKSFGLAPLTRQTKVHSRRVPVLRERIELASGSNPDIPSAKCIAKYADTRNRTHIRVKRNQGAGNRRKIGEHMALGIVFQTMESAAVDDE